MGSLSSSRGCAASFKQPLNPNDELAAECLIGTIHRSNSQIRDIVYRTSDRDKDILRHVFHWDVAPYQDVFQNGLRINRSSSARCDDSFYSLVDYVECSDGMPLDIRQSSKYAFISTTISNSWFPPEVSDDRMCCRGTTTIQFYRYEIYAPGGIWVAATLGDCYSRCRQDEVAFVLGITPQYIRSAQLFKLTLDSRSMCTRRVERADTDLIINEKFNPQSHPLRLLKLEDPVCDYIVDEGVRAPLRPIIHTPNKFEGDRFSSQCQYPSPFNPNDWFPQGVATDLETCSSAFGRVNAHRHRGYDRSCKPPSCTQSRDDSSSFDTSSIIEWYIKGVANLKSYVDSTFRSHKTNEAYYFLKNVCGLVDYAPGTNNDKVVDGPSFIVDMFQSLKGTPFGEHRIDCAFGSHDKDEAYIFSANLCARINYAPDTNNDKILQGPMPITNMFPFLKGTVFEEGVGAAIESTVKYEAYLFKGDQCARINYGGRQGCGELVDIGAVARIFPSLNGNVMETDLDAAYASHVEEEGSYLFKGNLFAIFHFGPGPDKIQFGPVQIGSEGPGMAILFPHINRGLDFISSDDSPAPIP